MNAGGTDFEYSAGLTFTDGLLSVTANTTRTGYNFRSKLAELHVVIVLLGMDD